MPAMGLVKSDIQRQPVKSKEKINFRTQVAQTKFLAAYSECGFISQASRWAKISRADHFRWMKEDPSYPDRFEEARKQAAVALEGELIRRAKYGVSEPYIYKGKPVFVSGQMLMKVTYSDSLLLEANRAHNPDRYRRDSKVDVTVQTQSDKVAILLSEVMSPQELQDLEARLLEHQAKKLAQSATESK